MRSRRASHVVIFSAVSRRIERNNAGRYSVCVIVIGSTLFGCGAESKKPTTTSPAVAKLSMDAGATQTFADAETTPSRSVETRPQPAGHQLYTVSLVGETPAPVPGTNLSVHISGSFHKTRAPLVGVSILVSAGDAMAEVGWRIESGKIDSEWIEISGRRYDEASREYVEETIPGWLVRLDSVDDSSAGGDPIAITISLKPVP